MIDPLELMVNRLAAARLRYPEDDYIARLYWCPGCEQLDLAIAPRADLTDDYACPQCGAPQMQPPRSQRRQAGRRRRSHG